MVRLQKHAREAQQESDWSASGNQRFESECRSVTPIANLEVAGNHGFYLTFCDRAWFTELRQERFSAVQCDFA
jgi:hypothetical protein